MPRVCEWQSSDSQCRAGFRTTFLVEAKDSIVQASKQRLAAIRAMEALEELQRKGLYNEEEQIAPSCELQQETFSYVCAHYAA